MMSSTELPECTASLQNSEYQLKKAYSIFSLDYYDWLILAATFILARQIVFFALFFLTDLQSTFLKALLSFLAALIAERMFFLFWFKKKYGDETFV